MKTLGSVSFSIVILCASMTSVYASPHAKSQLRNDRVSVSKGIQQYDINPFIDSKRVVRNDRVSYSNPKVKVKDETSAVQKHRFVRNDRMIVNK